ncbi:phage integrase SAM-like domain-containing protein [Dysgonomonas sp. Marseille-P4361]|uniref:tyrosine-type recombinase/integrase n=1 Tax=Dysgonomonas sp. Marseille-P4361 TaxID=2161820 RepID=UPI000D550746|nr:phage integrase SAM-like domain-containing protein [Dysgonomonas sp. Marseille-P4361]
MATLRLFFRSSNKKVKHVNLRARFSIDRDSQFYATLQTVVNIEKWDKDNQRLKLESKPKDFRSYSIEVQNDIIDKINIANEKLIETNDLLSNLSDYVTTSYNNHTGEFGSDWLQKVTDSFYSSLKPAIPQITYTLNTFISSYINDLETGKRLKKRSNRKVSEGTIKSYKGFHSQLKNYQETRKVIVDFDDITMDFYRDFTNYLLFDRKYSANTVGRMIKVLKTVMYAAKDMKLHNNREIENKDFAANYEDVDNVYLSDERVNILYNMNLSDNIAWEKVRDIFIVGCLTGQRVSDYKRINSRMIVTLSNGLEYIELKQEKTDKTVYIPLDWRVKTILDKYNGELPKTYDQKINDYIKKICEKAGFTELVDITQNKAGMEATTPKRFCDLVKTHTARRSLCTNMQKAGCKLSDIIAISGHESEEQLKTYLKLNNKEKAMLADSGYFQRVEMKIKAAN